MTTDDLERYRKIPRNDSLIYLHQNRHLDYETKVRDIYDRLNLPNFFFYCVIDNLLIHKLIKCENYISKPADNSSFLNDQIKTIKIDITEYGTDFVESRLFGYNLQRFPQNSPLEQIWVGHMGATLSAIYKDDFAKFCTYYQDIDRLFNPRLAYYFVTGKKFKEDHEKKVFISYSWDNESHKNWVTKLAEDLGKSFHIEYDASLKVSMDQYNFMKHNILSSDHVIIIFTPIYKDRAIHEQTSGVHYEFSIIQGDLFRKIPYGKYIPILKEGTREDSIPTIMQNAIYSDFTDDNRYQEKLNELFELIHNQ